ncbi:MAG TPA: secretin N-terminal domain-containing protein, partial [Phycisphaerae bacterium]|nr:secretin N-terminal domain-containing protein [Phycisphaerae bacterium]
MATWDIRDPRAVARAVGTALCLLLILGLAAPAARAQEPPPPDEEEDLMLPEEQPEPVVTTQPVTPEEAALIAAKQAAMASIDKTTPTTQPAGPTTPIAPARPGAAVPGKPGAPGVGAERGLPKGGRTPLTPGAKPGPQIGAKTGATPPGAATPTANQATPTPATPTPSATPGKSPVTPADKTQPGASRVPGRPGAPGATPGVTPTTPGTPGATPGVTPPGRPGARGGAQPPAAGRPAAPEGGETTTLTPTSGPASIANTATGILFQVGPPNPEARTYRFDYENTPWTNVLADFSRITGLPWLNQPEQPLIDTLTFRSPREFTYKEALDQLNELLLERPLNKYLVQRKDNYLTINRLPDLMKAIPVDKMFNSFEEFEAAKLDRFDLAKTRFKVPKGWSAFQVIERFRPEFSDTYGTEALSSDELELTGLVKEHYRFRDVVQKLAQEPPPPPDPRPMLTFDLKSSKVVDVANILKQMYPGAPPAAKGPGGTAVDPKAQTAQQVTIIPDVVNNRLIIRAQLDMLTEIGKTIQSLDGGAGSEPQAMKTIKLAQANALTLQTVLKPLFAAQKAAMMQKAAREYVPPAMLAEMDRDLLAEPTTNSVILTGSKRGVDAAEELVKQWDVADTNEVSEVVELKNIDSQMAATTLQAILAPMAQKGMVPPRIAPQSNTRLLVICNKNEFQRVRDLIDKIDVAQDDSKEHFVKLTTALPSVVAQTIQQLLTGQAAPRATPRPPAAPGQPAPQPTAMAMAAGPGGPRFIADDGTRMLIVTCSDKDWERVDTLIKKLDGQAQDFESKLVTFDLKNANAADVVLMLNQLFPAPAAKAPGQPAQMITADTFHNTVKVFAMPDFVEKITPFIQQLDLESEWPMTVIHLENAKAEVIAPILLQSVSGGAARSAPAMPPPAPGQPPRPMPAAGGSTSAVRIVAEPITNSLLVTAPPKELAQIKDLVAKMEEAETEAQVFVPVQNRSATEIADTLMSMMGAGARSRPAGAPAVPMAATAGKGFKAVPSGSRVMLSGSRDDVARAIQLIEQIDVIDQQPETRKYVVKDA